MRILVLTQNENLYLPLAIGQVCKELQEEVVCIVSAPAMSTHGGTISGFCQHVRLFGMGGTAIMVSKVLQGKVRDYFSHPGPEGPFYSLKAVARAFRIPFFEIKKVKSALFHNLIDQHSPELLVSMSCPQIIGKTIRDRFPRGCINVHGAPLPRYRGLMPAFWALRNGETMTAVTVHDLASKLDNGDILVQREVPIGPEDTWHFLVRKTKDAGAGALLEAIARIKDGTEERRPNPDEEATYFSFPTAKDRKGFLAAGQRFF